MSHEATSSSYVLHSVLLQRHVEYERQQWTPLHVVVPVVAWPHSQVLDDVWRHPQRSHAHCAPPLGHPYSAQHRELLIVVMSQGTSLYGALPVHLHELLEYEEQFVRDVLDALSRFPLSVTVPPSPLAHALAHAL